jgi:hypothetical protein
MVQLLGQKAHCVDPVARCDGLRMCNPKNAAQKGKNLFTRMKHLVNGHRKEDQRLLAGPETSGTWATASFSKLRINCSA